MTVRIKPLLLIWYYSTFIRIIRIYREINKTQILSKFYVNFDKEYGQKILFFIFLLIVSQNRKAQVFLLTQKNDKSIKNQNIKDYVKTWS